MSEKAPRGSHSLKRTQDLKEILNYLSEGARILAPSVMWAQGEDQTIQGQMRTLRQMDEIFFIGASPPFDSNQFQKLINSKQGECLLCVSLSSIQIFFKTKFHGIDSKLGLKFSVPTSVYKAQRRANSRLKIFGNPPLRISFQHPLSPDTTIDRYASDISAGGLSFIISKQESPKFPVGLLLEKIQFKVKNQIVQATGKILNKKAWDPGSKGTSQIRLGIGFQNISPTDQDWITTFVLEENRRYIGRLL